MLGLSVLIHCLGQVHGETHGTWHSPLPSAKPGMAVMPPPNTGLWDQLPPANVDRELHEDEAS